jgi:GH18 family chitinase
MSTAFPFNYPPLHHDTYLSAPHLEMYWNGVYYPNWRIYRDQPPSVLNFNVISHVFYAFAWLVASCIKCGCALADAHQGERRWHSIRMETMSPRNVTH